MSRAYATRWSACRVGGSASRPQEGTWAGASALGDGCCEGTPLSECPELRWPRFVAGELFVAACGSSVRPPDAGSDASSSGLDSSTGHDAAVARDAESGQDATCEQAEANDEEPGPCYLGAPGEDLLGTWEVEPGSENEIFVVDIEAGGSPYSLDRAGEGYGLLWSDSRELGHVWLSRLDANGDTVGDRVSLSGPEPEQPSPLVWTGTDHVLVWGDERNGEREIYLRPFSNDLVAGVERRLTRGETPQNRPGAAWAGDSVAVAWTDGDLLFQRADPSTGTIGGTERALTSFGAIQGSSRPDMTMADGRVAIAFCDAREGQDDVYLAIVDETGEPTTPDGLEVEATEWAATNPQVVWTGTEFVVAWNEEWSELGDVNDCTTDCLAGGCDVECLGGSTCTMRCDGGGCDIRTHHVAAVCSSRASTPSTEA